MSSEILENPREPTLQLTSSEPLSLNESDRRRRNRTRSSSGGGGGGRRRRRSSNYLPVVPHKAVAEVSE